MKCIVTGGAGFIGSHIVDRLIKDGNEVISLDNESASSNEEFYWNQKAHKAVLDICDYDKIEPLFKDVDCVFHLAAEARIQPAIKNPQRAVLTNVLGTCNVLQASRENGVGRVLYSSTSSAYGLSNTPPLSEDMPNDCLNPYSVTKVSGEGLCNMYNKLYGLKTVIFRYFNVYGERQPIKGQYAPVVGIFLRQFAAREPLTIVGQTINIGVGRNHSILDIAKMIGYNFKHLPERLGEARITLANIGKARELLGWKPETQIEDWIGLHKVSGHTVSPREWMKQR